MIKVTAPAKIILLGEHAVVYGQPAIAVPVSMLRATASVVSGASGRGLKLIASDLGISQYVTKNPHVDESPLNAIARLVLDKLEVDPPDLILTIKSDIPIASGLGSGAAISTVIVRALSAALKHSLNAEELNSLVYEVEKLHHGTPSGVDNTVIVYERPVYFVRGRSGNFLAPGHPFHFVIADTGVPALTRTTVGDVNKLYQAEPAHYDKIFAFIGNLVADARIALEGGNAVKLGSLMSQNHLCLKELTVSCSQLDHLVETALDAGALGAKLSGGGRGGNMIALVTKDKVSAIRKALLEAGAVRIFETAIERDKPC
jgi:mevalonate kinase